MTVKDRTVLHRVWDGFLDSVGFGSVPEEARYDLITTQEVKPKKTERSMSMSRLHEQVYYALAEAEGGWAYPIDIFVGDNGTDIFSIVAQSGKLFQVPLSVSNETVTLGTWTQVKEEFTPVTQNRFFIRRQKDGTYRWMAVAATSVLNRVGQIDSVKLFDSFIEKAEKRNQYPRLDFYHYGETDPKVWEFGTADYLAREGVCYIASGTFDEGHPLAEATIRACESDDKWGCSIEFYAYSEAETILIEPEVKVPVYTEGENTRISVVLEEDAAGLFTRIGVKEGITRAMDSKIREALEKLFGDDSNGLKNFMDQFEGEVDGTNKRVKNDKLIHRTVAEDILETVEEEKEDEQDGIDAPAIVLDEAAAAEIARQTMATPEMLALIKSVSDLTTLVTQSVVEREKDQKKIVQLEKSNETLGKAIERLAKNDNEKKSEYLQDLPSNKRQVVTFRPSVAHSEPSDEEGGELEDFGAVAERTLSKLPFSY